VPFKMERVDAARAKEVRQHAGAVREFGAERARLEGQRVKEAGPAAPSAARPPVRVRLPDAPGLAGAAVVRPAGPRPPPGQPAHPQPDLARKPEVRPPQPKVEARPPQPRPAGTLPHPEEVLHPDFNRRTGQVHPPAPVAPPPVRPNPPPAAHAAPPPITGAPHPGHVAPPAKGPPPKGKG
jgi:hypothetical protein